MQASSLPEDVNENNSGNGLLQRLYLLSTGGNIETHVDNIDFFITD